jgi:Fe-S oxidoreductase
MLTLIEKILFILLVAASFYAASITFRRMWAVIQLGQGGKLDFSHAPERIRKGIIALFSQGRIIRHRKISSLFHYAVAWGFIFYLLVNATDILEGFVDLSGFKAWSGVFGPYRLVADVLSMAVLIGVAYFLIRRFVAKAPELRWNDNVLLHPKAKAGGVSRDSLIVGVFILLHVGFRLLGKSFEVAHHADSWQPFATLIGNVWRGMSATGLEVGAHVGWWVALGLILAFLPYFPYTKHLHLVAGPFNFATRPERKALGALEPINFDDQSIEKFGVSTLTDLHQKHVVDAFACIMCNRCQQVCPAYTTGKELSPSALEINKRYMVWDALKPETWSWSAINQPIDPNHNVFNLPLVGNAISEAAVWACTSCGACIEVCPVGNEPMHDILNIRRAQVLMESQFPDQLKGAFTGMERTANPWQMSEDRMGWAASLPFKVTTVDENPNYDVLYWVGCAGAFDPNAQQIARAIATVLHAAGVNFAVLGNAETCTGDTARRAGNEYLFFEMAKMVIETLNGAGADKRTIVAGCPHCLHTIGKEYQDLGATFNVVHHTQFINTLVGAGKLKINPQKMLENVTFHDPCYLGRHSGGKNGEYDAPRAVLGSVSQSVIEMARSKANSFCCGAGGAQVWKEEEHGTQAVNVNRFAEAKTSGAKTLAIGCPFCARMLNDANAASGAPMKVRDVAELVADALV